MARRHIQDIRNVQRRYKKAVKRIQQSSEKTITEILIVIQNRAAFYTPQDTNALLNSQYRQVISETATVIVGRVGYTQNYAAALHERTDWTPMRPEERNPPGGAYNANAQPKFLELAAEEELPTIRKILEYNYRSMV